MADAPSLGLLKSGLGGALGTLGYCVYLCLWQGLELDGLYGHFLLIHSMSTQEGLRFQSLKPSSSALWLHALSSQPHITESKITESKSSRAGLPSVLSQPC